MTAWFYLFLAGLLEIVWATALTFTRGFTRPGPSVVTIGAAAASFFFLALALEALPVGTAYAIWVGIGIGGVALFGIVAMGEPATPGRLACLALILAGIVGLKTLER